MKRLNQETPEYQFLFKEKLLNSSGPHPLWLMPTILLVLGYFSNVSVIGSCNEYELKCSCPQKCQFVHLHSLTKNTTCMRMWFATAADNVFYVKPPWFDRQNLTSGGHINRWREARKFSKRRAESRKQAVWDYLRYGMTSSGTFTGPGKQEQSRVEKT